MQQMCSQSWSNAFSMADTSFPLSMNPSMNEQEIDWFRSVMSQWSEFLTEMQHGQWPQRQMHSHLLRQSHGRAMEKILVHSMSTSSSLHASFRHRFAHSLPWEIVAFSQKTVCLYEDVYVLSIISTERDCICFTFRTTHFNSAKTIQNSIFSSTMQPFCRF